MSYKSCANNLLYMSHMHVAIEKLFEVQWHDCLHISYWTLCQLIMSKYCHIGLWDIHTKISCYQRDAILACKHTLALSKKMNLLIIFVTIWWTAKLLWAFNTAAVQQFHPLTPAPTIDISPNFIAYSKKHPVYPWALSLIMSYYGCIHSRAVTMFK